MVENAFGWGLFSAMEEVTIGANTMYSQLQNIVYGRGVKVILVQGPHTVQFDLKRAGPVK